MSTKMSTKRNHLYRESARSLRRTNGPKVRVLNVSRCTRTDVRSLKKENIYVYIFPIDRDSCCTITLCDVTLGDHEIRAENSTDLSVNLTDVKVLNSTAIKLKLFGKNLETVAIEISDNNHVWRQQKPDKGNT